jgi:hypothetical protein
MPSGAVWVSSCCLGEQPVQRKHGADVWASDRSHFYDFAVDQLDAVGRMQDARLAHPVIGIHAEPVPGGPAGKVCWRVYGIHSSAPSLKLAVDHLNDFDRIAVPPVGHDVSASAISVVVWLLLTEVRSRPTVITPVAGSDPSWRI